MYMMMRRPTISFFFFFNDTATTEIYTLSLHDALPISERLHREPTLPEIADASGLSADRVVQTQKLPRAVTSLDKPDRKSTRLNSSHGYISYAVFCLKKKKNQRATSMLTPLVTD